MRFLLLACLGLTGFALPVHAWEFDAKSEGKTHVYYRDIGGRGVSAYAQSVVNFTSLNTRLRASTERSYFEFQPEVRFLFGDFGGTTPADAAYLSVRSPDRAIGLSRQLFLSETAAGEFDVQRLNYTYQYEGLEFSIGRKPFSLGVLRAMPVWNKFSRPLPVTAGPALIHGVDSLAYRHQIGDWVMENVLVAGPRREEHALFLQGIWFAEFAELHGLVARWWDAWVLGFAMAKDVGGATLRTEILGIDVTAGGPERQLQWGLGGEYALNENWSLLAEVLYQSRGITQTADYTVALPSRFMSFRGRWYSLLQAQYKANALWTLSLGILTNCTDFSHYLSPKAQYAINQKADFFVEANLPVGGHLTEYSARSISATNGLYYGAPTQITAGLNFAF
ncbi:MAG: hypothetical protein AB7P04_14905 [Bacteriovoracia bacterium]